MSDSRTNIGRLCCQLRIAGTGECDFSPSTQQLIPAFYLEATCGSAQTGVTISPKVMG